MAVMQVSPAANDFVTRQNKLLIDGQWVDAAAGETFTSLNPATEEPLASFPYGRAEDINRAVAAARRAFADDAPWRRMTPSERGKVLAFTLREPVANDTNYGLAAGGWAGRVRPPAGPHRPRVRAGCGGAGPVRPILTRRRELWN